MSAIGAATMVETPLVVQLLWIGLMNVTLQRCGVEQDNALQELHDAVVTNNCIIDYTDTQDGYSTVKGVHGEDKQGVINELRENLLFREKMITVQGKIISKLKIMHKLRSQLLEGRVFQVSVYIASMKPTLVVRRLWFQLMNATMQLCDIEQENALQELNDAVVTNNCIINATDTQDRNSTGTGEDEEDEQRVIDELYGLDILTKEVIRMAEEIKVTLDNETTELNWLYKARLMNDSSNVSASESGVHMLLRNKDSKSGLNLEIKEDMLEK